jgi:hypothetical protein
MAGDLTHEDRHHLAIEQHQPTLEPENTKKYVPKLIDYAYDMIT